MAGSLAVSLTLALAVAHAASVRVLRPGETAAGSLPAGSWWRTAASFELISPRSGPLTIEARSLDFDVVLRVSRLVDGADPLVLCEDDDGGLGTDSRAVIPVEGGARYRIEVRSTGQFDSQGAFEVAVAAGVVPVPVRKAREEAEQKYWQAVDDRAAQLGNVVHRVRARAGRAKSLGGRGFFPTETRRAGREAIALAETGLGQDDLVVASAIDALASALAGTVGVQFGPGGDRSEEVRELCERALAIRERKLPRDHPDLASTLDTLAWVFAQKGSRAEAKAAADRSLAIRQATLGADHALTARSLRLVAEQTVPAEAARALAREARAVAERALGPRHLEVGQILLTLAANDLRGAADHAGAAAFADEGFSILEEGEDLRAARPITTGIYGLYYGRSIPSKLLERAATRALAILEAQLGPEHPAVAEGLIPLAYAHARQQEEARRLELLERAARIQEKGLPPDDPALAQTLRYIGETRSYGGDYVGAREALERALRMQEKAFGPVHTEVGWTLHHLAFLLADMGNYAESIPYFERCLEVWEKTMGPRNYFYLNAVLNFGTTLGRAGEFERALALLERARAGLAANDPDDRDAANRAVIAMAELRRRMGDLPEARRLVDQAIRTRRAWFDLEVLADILRDSGDLEGAQRQLEKAIEVCVGMFGRGHPAEARLRTKLARVLWREGSAAAALESALRGEETGREHLRATARVLPERQALTYEAVRASGLDVALSVVVAGQGTSPEAAVPAVKERVLDALIRSRALVLDELAGRRRVLAKDRDPRVAALAGDLAAASGRLAGLVVRGRGEETVEAYDAQLTRARRDREQAERALAAKSVAFRREHARDAAGLAEIAAALPDRSALVSFVVYNRSAAGQADATPACAAFVLRAGSGKPVLVPLDTAEAIDAAVGRWRQEAAASPATAAAEAYDRAGQALRRAVWDPLAAHLAGAKRVFLVPDGSLSLVSFAALPDSGGSFLVESGPLLHYLGAERDLLIAAEPDRGGSLLALGGPSFDEVRSPEAPAGVPALRGARSDCASFQSIRFAPLPAAAEEARDVVAVWKQAGGKERGASAVFLSGSDASEAAFKNLAAGKSVVHLATHGFFVTGGCLSALAFMRGLAAMESLDPREGPAVPGESPLRLAGLALAGANQRDRTPPEAEDGVLTAEEVAAMDLTHAAWVVLSACDTGAGEIRAGEGVLGLRRAFQVAGARTIVMSLWPVDDEAGRRFMHALYDARFSRRLASDEAMRAASLEVLRRRREEGRTLHPFYWGGFLAAGDWR